MSDAGPVLRETDASPALAAAPVLSMLHEAAEVNSATRSFHGRPVLEWTLRRLARCGRLSTPPAILCWDDQAPAVDHVALMAGATVLRQGPRRTLPGLEAVSAALRWADGWRGGLLGACCFDAGFDAAAAEAARVRLAAEAVLLIDPASALLDAGVIDALLKHAGEHPGEEHVFAPAAPGLGAIVLREPMLRRLAEGRSFPGRLLSYWPDLPGRDPIALPACAPVPTPLARTTRRFTLDSPRQVSRFERATLPIVRELAATPAIDLLPLLEEAEAFPRDVTLELTTRRVARRAGAAMVHPGARRADLDPAVARELFAELAPWQDVRLTLAGAGDPLLHPAALAILDEARSAGVRAVHVESDLVGLEAGALGRLAEAQLDVLSVHLPALTPATYARAMGIDALPEALANLQRLFRRLSELGRATPLVVPTFVKLRSNLHEMEAWYDHWLRTVGAAVIAGASDLAGQAEDLSPVDMSPPRRVPCRRLASRVTILCDGRIVACENDVLGLRPLGQLGRDTLADAWARLRALREEQGAGRYDGHPLCSRCRDWHRP